MAHHRKVRRRRRHHPGQRLTSTASCVSHSVQFADGTKKSVGVILPASLTFNTGAPGDHGRRRRLLPRAPEGRRGMEDLRRRRVLDVPGNSSFDIEVAGEPYHYICHFG